MGAPESISIRAGLGPICLQPLVVAGAIDTTPIKPTLQSATAPSTGGQRTIKVKIVNPNATAVIAWQLVERGAGTPAPGALVATYAANAGSHILPGTSEILSFDMRFELVLVSDIAGNYSVTAILF